MLDAPAQPKQAAPTLVREPEIHVMPDKFIGAPAGRPAIIPVLPAIRAAAPSPVPAAPVRTGGPAPKKKGNLVLAIAIVLVLAGGGVVAYLLLFPTKPVPVAVVNVNRNTNVNRNVNVPPPQPPPPTPPPTPPTPVVLRSGPDADSDGLTDVEEKTIYRTDWQNVDTDKDSFNDGNEASHLYDPNKKTPALLKDSGVMVTVDTVIDKTGGNAYSTLVPKAWAQRGKDSAQFFVTAPTGEFFEVLETDKPATQSIVEWYLAQSPGTNVSEVERFRTQQGYDALRAPDRLTTYIDAGNGRVYTLTYNIDDQHDINFRTTYEVLINSFLWAPNGGI
jgi:hypothetical protein